MHIVCMINTFQDNQHQFSYISENTFDRIYALLFKMALVLLPH